MCRFAVKTSKCLCVALALTGLGGCDETFTIHARNYPEWKTLSENAKSFFPNNLPSSAHDIHARHEPDTLATNVAFQIGADNLADFQRSLKQTAASEVVWPRMRVNEPWWPAVLNHCSYEEAQRAGLGFFTYEQGSEQRKLRWGCAVDPKTLKVYFWY
jgi:hypothetical protein